MRSFILISLLFLASALSGQSLKDETPKTTRILFLLDASGSMLSRWEGEYRIDIAKRVLGEMVTSLDGQERIETALRVYGHQYPKDQGNCNDTRLEAPFAKNNSNLIKQRLVKVKPKGTTPLARSLEKCGDDFPVDPNARNIIIIITDGIESCDGDPCAISLMLQRKNIFLKPLIIGIGMDDDYTSNFACLGRFLNTKDPDEFKNILDLAIKQATLPSTLTVEILDNTNKPTETNLPVSFVNNFTGQTQKAFVHLLKDGQPEAISIDPILTYDVRVETIPPVTKRNVQVKGGASSVIKVKAPTGFLEFKFNGHNSYKNLKTLVRKAGSNEILNIQDVNHKERYLIGSYDIEVLTTPHVKFKNVAINNKSTKTLELEAPGILSILNGGSGYGAVYQLDDKGREEWVMDLEKQGNYYLQPGNYKLIFRPGNAISQEYSVIKEFKISPQASTKIKLY